MRNIAKTFLFVLTAIFFVNAQTPDDSSKATAVREIQSQNLKMVNLYKEKKFDEALLIGKSILEKAKRENLSGNLDVLLAITNLGEVYLAKSKETEAIAVFQMALEDYEKLGEKGKKGLESVNARMAFAYSDKKDYKNAEPYFLKSRDLTSTIYGAQSKKMADMYVQLAGFYSAYNKPYEAETNYINAVLINDKILKKDFDREDIKLYQCFVYHQAFKKDKLKNSSTIFDEINKKRGISADYNASLDIINGKALNLVKPLYPQSAKEKRAEGFAIVKVRINEQGNVEEAKAYCGFLDFVEVVEKAAMESKFTPTLKSGSPIRVTGDIVYKFTAR